MSSVSLPAVDISLAGLSTFIPSIPFSSILFCVYFAANKFVYLFTYLLTLNLNLGINLFVNVNST